MNKFNDMMKQMQKMQSKLMEAQDRISKMEVTGIAGGNAVSITVDGNGFISKVKIDSSIANPDDVSLIEDLIVAAYSNARSQLEEKIKQDNMMGGLLPPGMKLPF